MRRAGNMRTRGRLLIAFVVLVVAAASVYLFLNRDGKEDADGLKIVTTIFPVYDFTRAVCGDKAQVTMLLTPGLEAHSYEPKPSDIATLAASSLFIYTSADMEPWALDLASSLGTGSKTSVLEAGYGVPVLLEAADEEDEHTKGGIANEDGHAHDPHVWLDFTNAQYMVRRIADAMAGVDPDNAGYYLDNAEAYCLRLDELDAKFLDTVNGASTRSIVHGGHYAFGYMSSRYGLKYTAVQGFSPDTEPSPRQMSELADLLKKEATGYIFYEELIEPRAAKVIAEETGAKMLMLHAGHNISKEDFEAGVDFIEIMERTLESLKTGLGYGG